MAEFENVRLYEPKKRMPHIVAIGGGHGLSAMLRGLKRYTKFITAIVTVADDGGGSGMLREDLGMLPPGDIRNCIMSLANTEPTMQKLLNYRFTEGSLAGQSFGNLFLAAMNGISGSFDEAVHRMGDVLAITGRVLPVTNQNVHLEAEFDNGSRCLGESKIFYAKKLNDCRIRKIRLVPEHPQPLPDALEAIADADVIVLGPGSLYTSIIPNFLVDGISEAVTRAQALKCYVLNIMTQDGETDGYTAADHIRAIFAYAGAGVISATIRTSWHEPFCPSGGNSEPIEPGGAMSFSSNVKAELCKDSLSKKSCAVAEGYGVLLYCNTFSSTEIRIITESRDFAARLPRLFKKAFGITFDQEPAAHDRGKLQFAISSEDKIAKIFETLQMDLKASLTLHVNFGMLEEEAECMAYLRGAFLAGGSVTDPAKRYHLEMTTSHYKVSRETCALLIECGFSPKELSRGGNNILYFKQSDYIEDFLTAIGAQVSAMGVMEAKVEKDLRNGVNRRVNCETANLTKVVDASMGQMAAIRALEEAGELDKLPGKLRETALLRRENPEATLQELAAMLNPPITKSAINHRMRKLLELARALEE